jgi:hypothetical protein
MKPFGERERLSIVPFREAMDIEPPKGSQPIIGVTKALGDLKRA